MQTPQYKVDSLSALRIWPINASGAPPTVARRASPTFAAAAATPCVAIRTSLRMVEIYGDLQGRDLGAVSARHREVIAQNDKDNTEGLDCRFWWARRRP